MRKNLLKNKTVLCFFFEKSFQYFPCEVFLISSLESWIHLLLNLEIKLLLILESSWFLLMKLGINRDLELVDSILKSFFGLFVIIFVIIKTTWINLIHHHKACFYTEQHERGQEMRDPRLVSCERSGSGLEREFARKVETCERWEWRFSSSLRWLWLTVAKVANMWKAWDLW